MTLPEEWVPDEVPEDHWSKSAEWQEYKRRQEELIARTEKTTGSDLQPFQRVGTVTPGKRKLTTHELAAQALQTPWVDDGTGVKELTPASIIQAGVAAHKEFTDEVLENIAKTIIERLSKVTDASLPADKPEGM